MPAFRPNSWQEEEHAHQAEDDGGDAGEGLGGKLDDGHHLAVAGVLRQVDGRAHAQGQDDDHGQENDIEGVEDVGQDADGVVDVAGLGGQQGPADVAQAPVKDIADEEDQQRAGDPRAQIQQPTQGAVIRLTAG